ncbi:MAG: hypothetical protein RL885_07385 [Planctomycetota bacterium]
MRRRLPFLRLILLLASLLLFAAVAVLVLVRIDRIVVAPGHLEGGSIAVRTPSEGRVTDVLVDVGQAVAKGTELVRFDTRALREEKELLEARRTHFEESLLSLEEERRRLEEELHPRDRQQSVRALERAALERDAAETQHERYARLFAQDLATEIEVEAARLALELTRVSLEAARTVAEQVPARQAAQLAEIEQRGQEARSALAELALQEKALQARFAESVVCGTHDGLVLGLDFPIEDLEGRVLHKGDVVIRLAIDAPRGFEGHVDDVGRSLVQVGQTVHIRLDAYPWLVHGTLPGRIERIEPRRDAVGFPVRIAIDTGAAPGALFDGLSGEARILIEEDVSLGRLLLEELVDRGRR